MQSALAEIQTTPINCFFPIIRATVRSVKYVLQDTDDPGGLITRNCCDIELSRVILRGNGITAASAGTM
jgi:hypothetical protein